MVIFDEHDNLPIAGMRRSEFGKTFNSQYMGCQLFTKYFTTVKSEDISWCPTGSHRHDFRKRSRSDSPYGKDYWNEYCDGPMPRNPLNTDMTKHYNISSEIGGDNFFAKTLAKMRYACCVYLFSFFVESGCGITVFSTLVFFSFLGSNRGIKRIKIDGL